MAEDSGQNEVSDRSDEKLTPKEAYQLTEEQGMKGKTVAKMFDVSPSYVSQRKNEYEEAREDGRESVEPTDFERETLEEALSDEEPESNPYENECPRCHAMIPAPDTAGEHDCPECGEPILWDESEI